MKTSIFEFEVIEVNDQCFIVRKKHEKYIEYFTNKIIKLPKKFNIKPLSRYYPLLEICDSKTGKPLKLSKKDLLLKYNEINKEYYKTKAYKLF